jgi:hypothetical protein
VVHDKKPDPTLTCFTNETWINKLAEYVTYILNPFFDYQSSYTKNYDISQEDNAKTHAKTHTKTVLTIV